MNLKIHSLDTYLILALEYISGMGFFFSRHKQLKHWKIAHGRLQRTDPQRENLATPNNPNFPWASLLTRIIAHYVRQLEDLYTHHHN